MSSRLSVGLTVLRSTNFKTKTFVTAATISEAAINLSIISQLRAITTATNNLIITRNYQNNFFIDLNKRREQQQSPTAVKNTSLLKITEKVNTTRASSSFHKYKSIMDAPPGIFKGSLDRFNGVTIDSSKEFNAEDNFPEKLAKSLAYWEEQKWRAVWFHVKTEHSEWIPHLTKMKFDFHHAKQGMVVLSRWLPKNEYANLPVYSHTMLGVGGLVVNNKNEVLVVSDRFALIPNSWKLPGGYVEPKENIVDAAIREVREETGVETVFNTMVSIRHSHGGSFGCSDIYCVVGLTPISEELHRCEREIAKLQWMPCNEYLQHPNVHETNRQFLRSFLEYKKCGMRLTCEMAEHQILKKKYCLYYMKPNAEVKNGVKESDSDEDNKDLRKV